MLNCFADQAIEGCSIISSWKNDRSTVSDETQTSAIDYSSKGAQSYQTYEQETQTDLIKEKQLKLSDSDWEDIRESFLRVQPLFLKCLEDNDKTRAFDDKGDKKSESAESIKLVRTLCNKDLNEELHVTGLTWNCTGSTLAASFGRFDHEDWCTHKTSFCTWNLNRRSVNEETPDVTIESPCCIMCLSFHPTNPALIAGGNFNGEVIVWDLSREDDLVVGSSGIGNDAHREPVNKIQWINSQSSKRKDFNVVSVSGDGKILVWKLDTKHGKLKLTTGFVLMNQSLPRAMKVTGLRGDKEMGVTSVSFSDIDKDLFVLGSESGCIFKCNLHAKGSPAGSHIESSVPLSSPVTFTYSPHHGPVHSVDCSPFHRNAFLSAGMDQSIHVYNILQNQPMLKIEPGDGYLYSAKWSPFRPSVLAAVSEKGNLLIYDLRKGQLVPVLVQQVSTKLNPVYALQFNPHQSRLVATGDSQGYIRVYNLGESLYTLSGQELDTLDDIISATNAD